MRLLLRQALSRLIVKLVKEANVDEVTRYAGLETQGPSTQTGMAQGLSYRRGSSCEVDCEFCRC
jgi:hypothetical protein